MRFIGNKELITSEIRELLARQGLINKRLTLFDAFCGTGAVSDSLKDVFDIIANDALRWCTTYTRGRVCAYDCTFEGLKFDPFEHLNSSKKRNTGLFYKHYSPGASKRMYFTPENAARIDYFRTTIENWKESTLITEDEYAYLLASLIESVSLVSNTAGVYGAFLKHWDPRALKPIEFLRVDANILPHGAVAFLNARIEDIVEQVHCDILYIDPPYTQNQYGTQYHLLETLVLYDKPQMSAITGSRNTAPMRSDWSKAYKAHILFDRIVANTKAKYVLFSYSCDGFMSKSFIEGSLKRYGRRDTYLCKVMNYRNYTNFKSRAKKDHFEYLFFVQKKDEHEVEYESPLNYIGSKARMISHIKENLPRTLTSFVDACGGGFNVGVNVKADRIVYNDINHLVTNLVASFRETDTYEYILYLKRTIKKFGLEKENESTYNKIRRYYNSLPMTERDPKLLYAVILYGFNQQIRFNGNHDFNNPVGMRWFNDRVLEKMISFSRVMKEKQVVFESKDYQELYHELDNDTFIYLDPPYMLTNGSYNDGKRGFHGWDAHAERRLFEFADRLSADGRPFVISYVLEHKGRQNKPLASWIKRGGYEMIKLPPILGNNRKEILISNCNSNAKAPLLYQEQISETT